MSFSNLALRIISSCVLPAVVYGMLFHLPSWIFSAAVEVLVCAGLYEFYTMMKNKGVRVYRLFGVVIGSILPVVVYFKLGNTGSGEVLFLVLACLGLFLIQFQRKEDPKAIEALSLTLFGMIYISWFLSFIIRIQFLEQGYLWIAYLLLVTKGGDVGCFITGKLFGRHALMPHVSPKKSVEGLLGGVVVSATLSLSFAGVLPGSPSAVYLILIGSLLGLVAQCGDLSESLIKRYCGIKDSGRGFPGLGGVLDFLDSILLTAPLFYFHLKALNF